MWETLQRPATFTLALCATCAVYWLTTSPRQLRAASSLPLAVTFDTLQHTQNNLARVICQSRDRTDARTLLRSLHWLPVRQRVTYKMALLTHKVRTTATPTYLSELAWTRHHLGLCAVPMLHCWSSHHWTMSHIVESWMAAYLGYTLRMKMLFHGWPVMVHDTHTRRRKRLLVIPHRHRTGPSYFCCCRSIHLLTIDCVKTFSLSNATWKPICSNSLSPLPMANEHPTNTTTSMPPICPYLFTKQCRKDTLFFPQLFRWYRRRKCLQLHQQCPAQQSWQRQMQYQPHSRWSPSITFAQQSCDCTRGHCSCCRFDLTTLQIHKNWVEYIHQ